MSYWLNFRCSRVRHEKSSNVIKAALTSYRIFGDNTLTSQRRIPAHGVLHYQALPVVPLISGLISKHVGRARSRKPFKWVCWYVEDQWVHFWVLFCPPASCRRRRSQALQDQWIASYIVGKAQSPAGCVAVQPVKKDRYLGSDKTKVWDVVSALLFK